MRPLPQKRIILSVLVLSLVLSSIALFLFPSRANAVVPVLDSENLLQNTLTAGYLRALVEKEVGVTATGLTGTGAKAVGSAVSILKGGGTGAVGNAVKALTGGGTGSNAVTNAISALTGGNSMDAIAWTAANIAIEKLTRSAIDWINSGFEGGPMFITDFGGFLSDVADEEIGRFIEGSALSFLCDPFEMDIRIALALRTPFERRISCTLSDVIDNIEGFIGGDFSQGGWEGWFELTTVPQNNPYGAYLASASELEMRIASAQHIETTKLDWGRGFMSWEECEELPPDFVGPPRCEIVNPGVVIEEQLNNTLFSGQRRLEVADEVNEIISALFGQLINKILGGSSGGLRGLSEGSYSRPSYTSTLGSIDDAGILQGVKERFINEIDAIAQSETEYKSIKQNTLNIVRASESLLVQLSVCYAGKISSSLSSSNSAIAQQRMTSALATISEKVTPAKTSLENDIASVNQNLEDLAMLQSDVLRATLLEQLEIPDESFSELQQSGSLKGFFTSITIAQQEQSTITAQMTALDATTQSQISQCQSFPPPISNTES